MYDIQGSSRTEPPCLFITKAAYQADLPEEIKPRVDAEFEWVTEGEEIEHKKRLKTKWALLEAVVVAERCLKIIAQDFVEHFERRLEELEGEAMIVCMSRRSYVELCRAIVSTLSDELLAEVRGMPQRNLAVELSRKLIEGEIKARRRKYLVQARFIVQMRERAICRYQNRAIEAVQVIEELIARARDMLEADRRGVKSGLTEEEPAFATRWRLTIAWSRWRASRRCARSPRN